MSSCVSVPTETQFETQVVTSNSLSTSFSSSVSTEPPTTITSTSTICLDTVTSGSCTSTTTSLSIVTNPGSTSTISVPVVITVPVIQTSSRPTRTLFSTSCSPTTPPPTTPPTTPPTSPPSPTPTPTDSSLSETTPAPLTLTSASSLTLSNGSVVTTDVVLTQILPPTSVYVTASAPAFNSDGNKGSSSKTAPIVGGVVGGLVGLVALIGGIYFLWRRSKRWNDIFDREEDEKEQRRRMSLDGEDVQPRPYHYGLVGHSASPTPPSSPPLDATDRLGHSPSNSLSLLNAAFRVHSRSSSGQDVSPASMSRSASDLAVPPAGHTRPNPSNASSTASTRPLLERSVNPTRPQSSWSVGAQSITPGDIGRMQSPPQSPRPHSAGAGLPSGAAAAFIPGGPSTDTLPVTRSSPVNEKRRLREALPVGAAAPMPPSSSISTTSGPGGTPQGAAPPLTPRSPHRPSSSKGGVLVHTDGGSASGRQGSSAAGHQPPAYSPT